MTKLYGIIILVGIIGAAGLSAKYYYDTTQSTIATLRENNAKLEVAVQISEASVKTLEESALMNEKLNSKLQKEIDYINNKISNNFEKSYPDNGDVKIQTIGHNSNTKVDFYQEENLRLGSELIDTKKKFEILKNEIEKYENQRSNLITKINSVNDVINNSNVLTNVFENKIEPKVNILDPQNIQKKDENNLNEQVKAIFSKRI